MKLSAAIEALCVATRANGCSKRTVGSYRDKLKWLVEFLGDVDVEDITVHDLRRWVAHLMDSNLSPFTVQSRVRHAKRLFNWLAEEGDLDDNPMKRIHTPTPRRRKPKGIHQEDVLALLEGAQGPGLYDLRDRALILFLADTGARAGGVCGLKMQDLDVDAGLAAVTEKRGKTRYVMFTEPTAEALRDWLEAANIEGGPVFLGLGSRSEGALTPNGLSQMLRRRSAELETVGPTNPHAFRHAFARHYLLDGGDLGTLSELLGHESVEITKNYYAIFSLPELKKMHDRHSPVKSIIGTDGHE
jgi:integrase/recombinase XerC